MEKNIKKERLYVYNWVTLLYSRDWHDIVNQLYFNKKVNKIKNKDTGMWILNFDKYFQCALQIAWKKFHSLLHLEFACFPILWLT